MPHPHRRFSRIKLRERRRAAGLTLEQFAVAVSRSWSTVHEYERGRVTPPTDALPLIAAILDCELDDLFEPEVAALEVVP